MLFVGVVMTKYMVALAVFLTVCVGLALWRIDCLIKENTTLEIEKNECLKDKEEYKNAQVSSSKLIKTLRLERSKQSAVVDCSDTPLPEYVVRVFDQLK